LRDNFGDLAREAAPLIGLKSGDLVVDIGSNDGTLLGNFKEAGYRVLGIEPSQAGEVARQRGVDTLTAYFDAATAVKVRASHGAARLITAANVFAHIGNIHAVVDAIVDLLAPDGVFISESHYLLDLVETVQYDTIYHEHLRHYALGSLKRLLAEHGLEVFHVKRIPTHGGSIRVYAGRQGLRRIEPSVAEREAHEARAGITDGSALDGFRRRVLASKLGLHALIAPLKRNGARIYGIGAPSRASTLINYTGLDDGALDCVLEISTSHKLDKYMPGTRIPVLDEAKLFADQPEYAMLLSWHIADELMAILRKKGYRGRFIVPLPEPRIV
ncbi:MAG: methyltransferase domain-containing protein, partial [Proteobacteria bacterium]|nr:methyltransferase domain-containing protein [Pseudomonadota bacterium]